MGDAGRSEALTADVSNRRQAKALAIGVYPAVSLSAAREARTAAKKLIDTGQDPSLTKKVAKAARIVAHPATFDALAAELLKKKRREAKAETTISKIEWLLSFAKPVIGQRPTGEITAPEILAVLRTIEARGPHETTRRLRSTIGEVFR